MKTIKLKDNHLNIDNSGFFRHSIIEDYLELLGIKKEDIPSFIDKPKDIDEEDPLHLDNLEKAVEITYNMLSTAASPVVYIQPDCDVDGFTSSSMLFNYLKHRWPQLEIKYKLHDGKEHGINNDFIDDDVKLVFIPDAGSNDIEEQKKLIARGKTVIILDHHEIEDPAAAFGTDAIIVNNQSSPNFKNKNLSGAGVVYKFIKQMDKEYFKEDKDYYKTYGDLAAIGIIADAMNMTSLDNNYIAWYGLSNIHNDFIMALAKRQVRGIKDPKHLTKIDVAFYIAPVINGVIRSGTMEDKNSVFKALITPNCSEDFVHTFRGVEYHENLYEYAARIAANAKARQDSAKKKSFEWLCNIIKENNWDKDNIIVAPLNDKESEKVDPNITGLIAMELVKEFNKPCLVLRHTQYEGREVYGGSGRNGNFYNLPNLKDFIHNAGAYYVAGHQSAFGVFLLPEQIEKIRNYSDEKLSSSAFDLVYNVDYWFHTGERIDSDMLMEIGSYNWLWGNSIPEPQLAFSLTITKDQIQFMGKDKKSIKIKVDGVDFVAFNNDELVSLINNAAENLFIHIDFIGRAQINEWMGNRKPQVIIDDFTVFDQSVASGASAGNLLDSLI